MLRGTVVLLLGGGREVGVRGTVDGRRGEKMRQFGHSQAGKKTLQREAEFTAAEILQREEGSEKGDRNKEVNNVLITERKGLWEMRRGRRR